MLVLSGIANLSCLLVGLYALYRLGGVKAAWARGFRRRREDSHWHARESLFNTFAAPSASVVMVGDSLTELADWSELLGRPVLNRGISGDTTSGILKRIDTIASSCPRAIFLMAGSNDLFGDGLASSKVVENMAGILKAIRASCPDATVYLQSILPVSRESRKGIDLLAVNARLASLADGNQVVFVELFSKFEQDGTLKPELTFDGVHLNGYGYQLWRDAIMPFLESNPVALPSKPMQC